MRIAKTAAVALLIAALAWCPPASGTETPDGASGWYTWQVDGFSNAGQATRIYLYADDGVPTRLRVVNPNCTPSVIESAEDLGTLSEEAGVELLRDIAASQSLAMDLRQSALFWLAQSGSDTAFDYLNQLILGQ